MRELGERAAIARHLLPQRGQRGLPVRIDEQRADVVEELVADRAAHRPVAQPLAGIEDLLDPHALDAVVAEPGQVAGGVGEAVRVVDAEPVDQPSRTSEITSSCVSSNTAGSSWRTPASSPMSKKRR